MFPSPPRHLHARQDSDVSNPHIFQVEGMTCAACARRVERALAAVPGVTAAHVDAITERAQIEGEIDQPQALFAAVAAAGYKLRSPPPADAPDPLIAPQSTRESLLPIVFGIVLTVPLLMPMLGIPLHLDWRLQFAMALAVVVGVGHGFLRRAWILAGRGETAMDTLIALGAVLGLVLGCWEALRGAAHPPFEISASLITILRLGRFIEQRARHRTTGSIKDLLLMAPAQAERVLESGATETVAVSTLHPGDVVRVTPGTAIPVDGRVHHGHAEVAEALLTGEPLPVAKSTGDAVLAGSVVHGGSLDITVTAAGERTWLANLAHQVETATASRPPAQELADRVSAIFVPAMLVITVLTFLSWWAWQHDPAYAARIAITVLVVACPCALGLATPVAMAVGLGNAARQGVIVRDQRALDALGHVTDVVFDKTGTLTQGTPQITTVQALSDIPESRLLAIAAALERTSEHPLARALREHDQGLEVNAWRALPGKGVAGTIANIPYRLGSLAWTGVDADGTAEIPAEAMAIALTAHDQPVGIFQLSDPLRPETESVVNTARARGLRIHLLSGDRPAAVERITAHLKLDSRQGGIDPAGKAARIIELQATGAVVAFAGDGINDATALATADAGISLPGLDATAAAAGLNLHRPGLQPFLDLHALAIRLRRIIRQNLAWAFGYNLILVPIAALGLLEQLGGPVLAGLAMTLSSITVVLNALRLRSPLHT